MPKQGYSVITVPNITKEKLTKLAGKINKSVPETISYLLENCKQES